MPHKCEELHLIPRPMFKSQEVIVSVMRRQSQDDPWSSLATSLAYLVNKRPCLRKKITTQEKHLRLSLDLHTHAHTECVLLAKTPHYDTILLFYTMVQQLYMTAIK